MRKVILSMMVSVDGYIEGNDPGYNWHTWDEEMSAYMMGFFSTVDTFIYGRKSYEAMITYWPGLKNDFADIMNQTSKLIFSRTLEKVTWNARLIKTNVAKEMQQIKKQAGKNLVLFAGADLADTFIKNNLIDEYRIIVNPVLLGSGKPLFKNNVAQKLKLKESINFSCGNIILVYEPLDKTNALL